MSEIKRQETKKIQLLNVLRKYKHQGITNVEMSQMVSLRYGGYLGKLYEEGYQIRKEAEGNGVFRYFLVEEPAEVVERKKAIDVLLEEVEKATVVDVAELTEILNELGISVKYKANTYNKAV